VIVAPAVASVLVIDDDRAWRLLADEGLSVEGFDVRTAGTLDRGQALARDLLADVIVLDRRLPDGDGLAAIPRLRANAPSAPDIIMMTADDDTEAAGQALRAGADFITKPTRLADLLVKVRKILELRRLRDRVHLARLGGPAPGNVAPIAPRMKAVVDLLARAVETPLVPVLLTGAAGSGKRHTARVLHEQTFAQSDADAPFVVVECDDADASALDRELFGDDHCRGLIEKAAGGTMFLSQVDGLPLELQAKLADLLENGRQRRARGRVEPALELRIVAGSTTDLRGQVRLGTFRHDLSQRLTEFSAAIPLLAERREDVPGLARSFARWAAGRLHKPVAGITAEALGALQVHAFPGNVRELQAIIQRAVISASGPLLATRDLMLGTDPSSRPAEDFFHVGLDDDGMPLPVEAVERAYVGRVLEHCRGHRTAAAQRRGISYPTILKRLRELGL
jgi:two-component system response regulator AtoC